MKTRIDAGMMVQMTSRRWLPWKYWATRPGRSPKRAIAQTSATWVPMKTIPVIQRMITKRLSISRPKVETT